MRDLFQAAVTGFLSAWLVSFPIGPVNLTIINAGARRGFEWAALIGLGAAVMETLYCSVAFFGFASFFSFKTVKAAMELSSFLLVLYLGLKFLRASTIEEHSRSADRIEEQFHPHSAFMIGFVRTLGNPGVLLLWLTLGATFIAHEWVLTTTEHKMACVAGVSLGTLSWFTLLGYAVSRGHRKFSARTLLRMEHVSGLCLLVLAMVLGIRIILLLRRHGAT